MVVSVSVVYHCDCMADLHKVKKLKSNHCKSRPLYMGKFCDWISWNGHRMRIIMSHMKAHCGALYIYQSFSPVTAVIIYWAHEQRTIVTGWILFLCPIKWASPHQ